MSSTLTQNAFDLSEIVKNLVTDDGEPVDSLYAEKQQRLLVEPLYASWTPPVEEDAPAGPRKFWASSNVGVFRSIHLPAIVPDMFLSLDVAIPPEIDTGAIRSYFMWETGKAPDVVVEIVSNREGNELGSKLKDYAQMGVTYYVVFDPFANLRTELKGQSLVVYEIGFGKRFRPREDPALPEVGLQLTMWKGLYEAYEATWLRWADRNGNVLLTSRERMVEAERHAEEAKRHAGKAERHAEEAERHAEEADARATMAEDRAARLAAKLREMGLDPEKI